MSVTDHSALTPKQAAVLSYMKEFFAANDQLPPLDVISDHFGFRSGNGSSHTRQALVKAGYIERNSIGKYRFVRKPAEVQP